MQGFRFEKYIPQNKKEANFQSLLNILMQLLIITAGNLSEALEWLNQLDRKYNLTSDQYGIGDFIEDLKRQGYMEENPINGEIKITAKSEKNIRKSALDEIFGKLKKGERGNHNTYKTGQGEEPSTEVRPYEFGDRPEQINVTDSIRNAYFNHGINDFTLTPNDLEVYDSEYKTNTATVLMIDISHSMILYGEDRITPAKKVAMALAELITTKYPKDTLDIIVFGNDAWQIQIKDLPYLQVGPYHTNTVAGLELAMDILRRRKTSNKQIFMITDGKPTCIKEGIRYYKNSFGIDKKILNKTLTLAKQCQKLKIPVTTFMIASDPYLQEFVRDFTKANNGKAYYSQLDNLGSFVFEDFQRNKRKNIR